ncbi:MAG: nitroreductase family deazaflavin-dependent oxidoreductase [Novosphingobium sp.]|nr:nitroreductase family deazaflavin-dependent oxidoreductase [Novosphingobium sp.]
MSDTPRISPDGTDISLVNESHVKAYQETNGEIGYLWNGATTLLFTHRGRKTGQLRTNAIIFTQVGNRYVIIASKGGSPTHPGWYHNILADPNVEVQIKGEKFAATARVAESPEREELWAEAVKQWPNFDVYQARTTRKIPVVVLERKQG